MCSEVSKNKFLLAYSELHDLIESFRKSDNTQQKNEVIKEYIKDYGTNDFMKKEELEHNLKASDISLQNYASCFSEEGFDFLNLLGFRKN